MAPALATAADAAYWAGRPVGTIWRWASEGRINRYGSGKNVRYNVHEIPKAQRDEWTRELIRPGAVPALLVVATATAA